MYSVKAVVSQKWSRIDTLPQTTNRKCHVSYQIVQFAFTLNDLEGRSAVVRLTSGIRGTLR